MYTVQSKHKMQPFVEIRSSLHLLERIACSIKYNESVLLVGETGTGKTTLVQSLARRIGHNFTVLVYCFFYLFLIFPFVHIFSWSNFELLLCFRI